MSLKKISKNQPDNFEFNEENKILSKKIISNYPTGRQKSAVMALLYIAQRQNNNWIPLSAIKYIANFLTDIFKSNDMESLLRLFEDKKIPCAPVMDEETSVFF